MKYKPNSLQAAMPISRSVISLLIAYAAAILISPAKIYTAIFFLKIFTPIAVIIGVYQIAICKSAEILISQNSVVLNLAFGRRKNAEIPFSAVSKVSVKQNPVQKLLSLYAVKLETVSDDIYTQDNISLINQYMIFSKDTAEEIKGIIEKGNSITL